LKAPLQLATDDIIIGGQLEGTTGQFGLVPYGVEVLGNIIRVFNN